MQVTPHFCKIYYGLMKFFFAKGFYIMLISQFRLLCHPECRCQQHCQHEQQSSVACPL